jgi:ParB/RepB/Spo0J family partition protein
LKYQKIDIGSIDITSPCWNRFTIAFQSENKNLAKSLKKCGLISPIKVWKKVSGHGYWLLTGLNRLKAAIRLKWEKIPALVYLHRELTEMKALELALIEIHYGPQLSDAEKAFFLTSINRCFALNPHHIAEKYALYLKIDASEALISDYIKIGKLSKKYLLALHKGDLSMEQLQALLNFKKDERKLLLDLLCDDISLNRNESLEFFHLVADLMFAKRCSAKDLFCESGLSTIYRNITVHKKRRGAELLGQLRKMRYPKIHQAMNEFQRNIYNAGLPNKVQVQHPSYFEGGWLRFVIESSDEKELAQQLDTMHESLTSGKIKTLFRYI